MPDDRYYRDGVPDADAVLLEAASTRAERGRPPTLWQARLGGRTAVYGAEVATDAAGLLYARWGRLTPFVDDGSALPFVDWSAPRAPFGPMERPDDAWQFRPLDPDGAPREWCSTTPSTIRLVCAAEGLDATDDHLALDVRLPSPLREGYGMLAVMAVRCPCGGQLEALSGPRWREMRERRPR